MYVLDHVRTFRAQLVPTLLTFTTMLRTRVTMNVRKVRMKGRLLGARSLPVALWNFIELFR